MASPLPNFERLPTPSVQLRHELPCGEWHIDWLLAPARDRQLPLTSFRSPQRIDAIQAGQRIVIARIADHRPAYLSYEGPISGNRGHVERICHGRVDEAVEGKAGESIVLRMCWMTELGQVVQHLSLSPVDANQWTLTCIDRHKAPVVIAAGHEKELS